MARSAKKPSELRDTWRAPEGVDATGSQLRWGRRLAATAVVLGLGAIWYYTLFEPVWHPRVHFFTATVTNYVEPNRGDRRVAGETARFVAESVAPLAYGGSAAAAPVDLRTAADWTALLDRLRSGRIDSADVVLVWINAQGASIDGKPVFLGGDSTVANPDQGRYPLAQLLDALRASPAKAKVLLLDGTGRERDPRLGVVVNDFARAVAEAVAAAGDERLWLLTSTAPYETSHIAAERKQTVFGHFVGRGLAGAADANGDQFVDLGELRDYVHERVIRWAASVGDEFLHQQPQLVSGRGGDVAQSAEFPVLVPVPTVDPLVAAAAEAAKAKLAGEEAPAAAEPAPAAVAASAPAPPAAAPPAAAPTGTGATPAPPETAAKLDAVAATPAAPTPVDPATLVPKPDMHMPELLELNRRALAAIETREPSRASPIDFAPHLWRGVRRELNTFVAESEDPNAPQAALEETLRRRAESLAAFAAGRPVSANDERIAKLAAARSAPPLDVARLRTWALVERLAADGGPPLHAPFESLLKALDGVFAADDSKALPEFLKTPWPKGAERYDEVQFARSLCEPNLAPWAVLQAAWRSCRRGERLAADPAALVPAVAARIRAGDREREAARRAVFDQTALDWTSTAERAFRRALAEYDAAEQAALLWHRTRALIHDVLFRGDAYIAWYRSGADDAACAPRFDDLVKLFEEVRAFAPTLDDPRQFDPEKSGDFCRRVERLRERIESSLQPQAVDVLASKTRSSAADRRRLAVLLATNLLRPDLRTRVEEAAARMDELLRSADDKPTEAKPLRSRPPTIDVAMLQRARALELQLAGLADARFQPPSPLADDLDVPFSGVSAEKPNEAAIVSELRSTGAALAKFYDALPGRLDVVVRDHLNRTNPTSRSSALPTLRAAERALYLVDVRDIGRIADVTPLDELRRAAWYDLLLFERERFLRRRADAPPSDAVALAEAAEDLGFLARQLPREPAVDAVAAPLLRLSGPSEFTPSDEAPRDWSVDATYLAGKAGPVWLVLEYDPERLEVALPSGVAVYPEYRLRDELESLAETADADWARVRATLDDKNATDDAVRLRAERLRRAAQYPLDPSLAALPASVQMATGENRRFTFRVRRKSTAAGTSKLILKAVTDATHVRHESRVVLPPLNVFSFAPAPGSGAWSPLPDGIVLHPWPNRTTEYEFQLANLGSGEKIVDVEFVAPETRRDGVLPTTLQTVQTSEVATLLGPARTIEKINELRLPAGGKPVTLAAPKPKDDKEPPKTPDEKNRAETDVGLKADAEAKPAVSVRHGMVVVVRARDTGDAYLRRIDFRPERPRRYVRPQVGYNPDLERIEIRVRPLDRNAFPAGPVEVRADFPEPLPQGTVAQLRGTIQAPDYEARLFIEAPASDSRVQTVYLDVDGYPRAFIYRVPCGPAATNLPEANDVLDVRLTAPAANTMYKAPATAIDVAFQVDAPPGAFEQERDVVEVGIDRDRDRDFSGEPTLTLHADRQADVLLERFGLNGIVAFRANVGDFKVAVPGGALQNLRVNLVAKVQTAGRTAWSRPVEIGLDGAPPKITRVEIRPERLIALGTDVEVDAWSVDAEMSGTAKVEVGFDADLTGKFSEKVPPLPAVSTSPPLWTVKLPTAPLPPGPMTILLRPTDKVGNVGEITKVRVQLVSPGDLAALKAAGSRIIGTVRYGGDPLPQARVTLQSAEAKEVGAVQTDADGRFALEGVPPGTYKLAARGLSRNKPRTGEQQVVVPAPPAKTPRIELDVR
jgi:hypothetical protein